MKVPARIFSVQAFHISTNERYRIKNSVPDKEQRMKKSVRLLVAVFAALVATTIALIVCTKKSSASFKTDYEAAKKSATRHHTDIFLLFSGDDWDTQSQ